jgi:hypothetical protein
MSAVSKPSIVDRGLIFQAPRGDIHAAAAFPSVCAFPGGRWLCGFRAAPRKKDSFPQTLLLTWSDDAGRTWRPPAEPFVAPDIDGRRGSYRTVGLTTLGSKEAVAALYWVDSSDPSRPFFNEKTEGLLDSRIFLSETVDAGETWSAPRRVDTGPFTMPTPATGPLLLLKNGEWAVQFETNKPYDDPSPWVHSSVLIFSADRGRTWPRRIKVSEDPTGRMYYWDQRPAVLSDGELIDFFWTFDRVAEKYLNLHVRSSSDHGRTWSPLREIPVPGQAATPVGLPGGRVFLPYMDRTGAPLLKARVSPDRGLTWPEEADIVLDDTVATYQQKARTSMQETWSEMSKFSIGFPGACALSAGEVLVVYYAGFEADHTGIRWARVGV